MKERDDELLAAIASGDIKSFEPVYLSNKDELLTVALWVIGDYQAAEDVTHDVFLAFVQRAGQLPKNSRIRPYLVTSCVNKARDHLRRKRPTHLHEMLIECPDPAAVEPVDIVVGDEQSSRLLRFISRLPPEQREVLAMRVQGEMTFREIAESTSCSINTVQSRYRYAVGTLRRMFHEYEKEPT